MGNIGDPISSGSIPAVGTAGTTYASNLNLFLTEVKNRLEAQVPRSSLEDGDLDMNGSDLQNAGYVGLEDALSAPTTPSNSLQAFGGNLYWINVGGAVQLTSGTSLNTAAMGGITGDYGGVNPAQFRFVDADQEFYAYDDYAGAAWARIWAKNFDLAAGSTSSNRVRMAYGGAGSYTMTLPASLPGSTSYLTISSSGQLSTSKSQNKVRVYSPGSFQQQGSSNLWTFAEQKWTSNASNSSTANLIVPIDLPVGVTITNVSARISKVTANSNTVGMTLYSAVDGTTNAEASGSNNTNAGGLATISSGTIAVVTASTTAYYVKLSSTSGVTGGDFFYWVSVDYTETPTL